MQPSFHDSLGSDIRQNGLQEGQASQVRYASEQRDRWFIRRALDQGTPEKQIEGNLALTTQFERLNPGQDVYGYIRGLIDEEKTSFEAASVPIPPSLGAAKSSDNPAPGGGPQPGSVREPSAASDNHATDRAETVEGAPHRSKPVSPRAQASEAAAREYVRESFQPTDWLAVLVLNRETGETIHRMSSAQSIAGPDFQAWLRHKNAQGSDIYLSLNTFNDRTQNRTKTELKTVRHVYLDLDEDGPRKLAAIRNDSAVPTPNYVLNTSPGKYQVIWRIEGIGREDAEELLRSLTQRFGGDPAATDSTRVFRLPGFGNKKNGQDFQVTITHEAPARTVYHASDFRVQSPSLEPNRPAATPGTPRPTQNGDRSQSEKDYGYAVRKLRDHEDPAKIIRDMAGYRSQDRYDKKDPAKLVAPKKSDPQYYAEHTVAKVMAELGMTRPPARNTPAAPAAGGGELEPSR